MNYNQLAQDSHSSLKNFPTEKKSFNKSNTKYIEFSEIYDYTSIYSVICIWRAWPWILTLTFTTWNVYYIAMFYYKVSLSTVQLTMQWWGWYYCAVQSPELHHWKTAKHIFHQIHITSLNLCFSNVCHKIMGHKLSTVYTVMQCFFQRGQNINCWNSGTFWNTKSICTHTI
jgi:hypothetical protein